MKFRKKPVVIEAHRWTKDQDLGSFPDFLAKASQDGLLFFVRIGREDESLQIKTLEGTMRAESGDWIIQGVKGELYPCKPDIFEATYEAVVE